MEFGVLGLDGFSSNRETKRKPITSDITLDFSPPKVAKVNGDYSPFNNGSLRHSSYVLSNEQQERNMLSFSSPKLEKQNFHNSPFAYFQHPNPSHSKNADGWSPFQLRFSNNNDPEPGRCRRTDGKKWRCSRDAVLDQKYCERHINRGRHRSRKPVEPLSGHSLSKSTCNNSSFSSPALAASNTVSVSQKYSKEFHSNVSNHMTTPTVSRLQVR